MLALTPPVVPVLSDAIYAKTAKGRDEVARRCAGLSSRQRSILILIDGHRRVEGLAGLMPAAQVMGILETLQALALIAPALATPTAAPGITPDPRLAPIKEMMHRTASTYLGPMAADLIRQIEAAGDEAALQRALAHWHMAMQASKYGRDDAGAHLALIRASLQDVFA